MYNRYIRTDTGTYSRIPQEESHTTARQRPPIPEKPHMEKKMPPPPSFGTASSPQKPHAQSSHTSTERTADGLSGILRHFLDQFHLDHVDTGDLLLLGLLFFLFREDADEELLVALGLLLIL